MRRYFSSGFAFVLPVVAAVVFPTNSYAQDTADGQKISQLEKRIEALESTNNNLADRLGKVELVLSSRRLVAFSVIDDVPPQFPRPANMPPGQNSPVVIEFARWLSVEERTYCWPFRVYMRRYSRWVDSEGHDRVGITCGP